MVIAELNDEYTAPTGNYKKIFTDQIREAPVMYHADNGMYYLATSSCTGYDPNSMLYAISRNNSILDYGCFWIILAWEEKTIAKLFRVRVHTRYISMENTILCSTIGIQMI